MVYIGNRQKGCKAVRFAV